MRDTTLALWRPLLQCTMILPVDQAVSKTRVMALTKPLLSEDAPLAVRRRAILFALHADRRVERHGLPHVEDRKLQITCIIQPPLALVGIDAAADDHDRLHLAFFLNLNVCRSRRTGPNTMR